jgi:hypothetical protein
MTMPHGKRACIGPFKDFFAEKPEPVIELGGNQGMVVKLS